ncbi:MAG: dicarboxylate/amino acid:cation symporter [Cytophagales bacterium]|nr:MAG: dicarboxylate/amino acid:cation symporter [Cytophagales bacterium]
MNNKKISLLLLFFLFLVAGLHLITFYEIAVIPKYFLLSSRIATYIFIVYYGIQKKSLTTWIFISMILGAEFGYTFPEIASNLKILSKIFLRLIKSIIAPLLIATLSVGIAAQSDTKQLGRMAWKALLYFEVVTTIALVIGIFAINMSQAGVGINFPKDPHEEQISVTEQKWQDIILHVFPENIAKSIAEGQILQVVVFSILFGIGLSLIDENHRKPLTNVLEGIGETMFKYTSIIMYFAPVAVFGAIAYTVSHMGLGILINLMNLLLTLYFALFALILLVFLPIALIIKLPIRKFITAVSEPVSIAFATTTSEAALPKAMSAMESLGVPRKVVAFIMPMGYSFNLDGSTLYLSLASIFVAQAAGIHMSWEKQFTMVLLLMLTSKGVAGVPRATLVVIVATAASFGLPLEPIFIILGIDELMDMGRSAVNVLGNCLATYAIGSWEGAVEKK